mmetsp:Transcript_15495/g.21772  ORF Transcript_15495/g.21772 Transcript_15495/m.21772 type:complete len:81 (-) Transcript_15495:37-279(-)
MEYTDATPSQQTLYYNQNELKNDSKTLADLEIYDGSTIYMKVDSTGPKDITFAGLQEETPHDQESGFDGSILASWATGTC